MQYAQKSTEKIFLFLLFCILQYASNCDIIYNVKRDGQYAKTADKVRACREY